MPNRGVGYLDRSLPGQCHAFDKYRIASGYHPLFIKGDALEVLGAFPDEAIDCTMTSPPYWGQRSYSGGGIGLETSYQDYVDNLAAIFAQVHRVTKRTGSFWLNIGDAYQNKKPAGSTVASGVCIDG